MSDMNNQTVEQPVNFDAIKIGLASPELIRQWSETGEGVVIHTPVL